jgi:preprotein translocase SecF subunit
MEERGLARMLKIYQKRHWFFALSILLLLIGVLTAVFAGIELDIQFRGGSIIEYAYTGSLDLKQAEETIAAEIGRNVTCQEVVSFGDQSTSLMINVAGNEALSPEMLARLEDALVTAFPSLGFKLNEANLVDPFIGRELMMNGIWAILITSVLVVAYVSVRFRTMSGPSAGVMALVALFHDVLLVFFVFVVLRIPLNESMVAVVLSILGYSLNDTIVIYDRIRENERNYKGKMPLADLADLSVNQSLSRSINTTMTTVAVMAIAYIFATAYNIQSIKEFALPMLIGLVSGTYSSIFIATPLWVSWKTRRGRSGY